MQKSWADPRLGEFMSKHIVLLRSNPVAPDPPVEKVADTLLGQGYTVTIVGWERNTAQDTESALSLPSGQARIVRFGIPAIFGGGLKKNLKPLILFQRRLLQWLKRHNSTYDILHAFDFDTGFVANRIAKRYKKPLVYHILDFYIDSHGLKGSGLGAFIKKMEFSVINRADCTVICTEKRKEQIAGSRPKRLKVIHNTPNRGQVSASMPALADFGEACKIVYVGILAGSRFIRETMELVKQDPRFSFHIGGFGKMEDEIRLESQNCPRIVFHGTLPYSQALALEQACDVMIAIYDPAVPNHQYAAPNKFYESLMLGKPVIMAHNTGFDDIISDNGIGCLIDYAPDGLQRGLEELLSLKSRWAQMGDVGRSLYTQHYSWVLMQQRLTDIYSGL